ncbi:MAG: hypothetical protein ACYDAJ_08775 [Nitrosotalea sp.]
MIFLVADLTNTSLINENFGGGGSVVGARLKDANVRVLILRTLIFHALTIPSMTKFYRLSLVMRMLPCIVKLRIK